MAKALVVGLAIAAACGGDGGGGGRPGTSASSTDGGRAPRAGRRGGRASSEGISGARYVRTRSAPLVQRRRAASPSSSGA